MHCYGCLLMRLLPTFYYSFSSLSESDSGMYYCEAYNSAGWGSPVERAVIVKTLACKRVSQVKITGQKADRLYNRNERLTLQCAAQANPAAVFSWYKDDELYSGSGVEG